MKKKTKYESAVKILKDDDFEIAERKFKTYLAKNPDDLKTQIALGNFYTESGEYFSASATINNVLEKLSNKMFENILFAHNSIDENNFDRAAEYYEKALSFIDQNIKARNVLKSLYIATKSKEQLKNANAELNDIENTRFMYNFQLGNIRSGLISKEEAHDILYDFIAPHYPHITSMSNLHNMLKNFVPIDIKILENPTSSSLKKHILPKPVQTKSGSSDSKQYLPELSIDNRFNYFRKLGISNGYIGEKKFAGYCIFEYKHLGISILEKFYKINRFKEFVPSYDNATYIFPINMDDVLSTYSKTEIISMMKTMPQIERVYHNKNYYDNLDKKIKKVKTACDKYKNNKNASTQADDNDAPELC